MAAYAALVSLGKVLDQILDHDQYFVSLPEKKQIKSLQENIVFLLKFLEDFPAEAGKFEARITVAANEAENIIEYHLLNAIASESGLPYNWQKLVNELEKATLEIHTVLEEAKLMSTTNTKNEDVMSSHSSVSVSSSLVPKENDTVVGLEEDLMMIKGRLYGEPSKLQIIPIVGMGGIGKTTLARYALDDPSTHHHFDVRAWVSVSQNYIIKRIFLGLLNSIGASTKGECDEDTATEKLLEHVFKHLRGRRYLIVIDDIWDAKVWDVVQRVFPDDLNGSRIIITSRELEVASYVDSSSRPHEMRLMGKYQSWQLLKKKVFGQEICPPVLDNIGRQIAEKCRGLPLAIAVTAGVLSKVNRMQGTWENVASNVSETVNTSDEPFAEILSLSYAHLPHHLRLCFLYIGCFPEDYEINVSVLMKLWAAEGFLKSNASEEAGEDYLEDLAKRSLVLINRKRSNGKIKTIKIHDLLRDFCLSKARDEKFLQVIYRFEGSFPEGIENSHRLSILTHTWGRLPDKDVLFIRTLLLFYHWDFDSWKSFRLLKVVDANTLTFTSFSDEIGELLLLRYLAVSFRGIQVPESWSKLQNLQTLIICNLEYASCLPFGIWRMPQLRHVILLNGFMHDPRAETCDQILALEHLQTLKRLRGFTCSERILELIPNLRKLGIFYAISDVCETGWSKYCLNNLVRLQKLEKMNLYAIPISSQSDLSKNIAFPVTLKKLSLTGSGIPWEDMSIVGTLPNLEVLKLKRFACLGFEWETTEGQFCQLRQLLIERTDPHRWTTESSHFPRLERLRLHDCHSLVEIPYGIGEIPTLQLIEVDHCNSSIEESAKLIEEDQRSFGSDLLVHLN